MCAIESVEPKHTLKTSGSEKLGYCKLTDFFAQHVRQDPFQIKLDCLDTINLQHAYIF